MYSPENSIKQNFEVRSPVIDVGCKVGIETRQGLFFVPELETRAIRDASGKIGLSAKTILALAKEIEEFPSSAVWLDIESNHFRSIHLVPDKVVLMPDNYTLYVNNLEVKLRTQAFSVLNLLADNPNRTITRQEFYQKIWQKDYDPTDKSNLVDANVKFIRKALGEYREIIQAVREIGYRLVPQEISETN